MEKKSTPPPRKGSKPISDSSSKGKSNRTILWIGIAAAGVLVVALIVVAVGGRGGGQTSEPGVTVAEQIGQPVDRRVMGDPAAPVLIEAYEDYQCPHCQRFNTALEDTIRNDLVAPGKARYEYKNRFVISVDSMFAAAAAECAADQGMFWEYHDQLFSNLERNPRFINEDNLKSIARDLGLDTGTFDRCLDTREHYPELEREDNEAANKGINATPTIFINGVRYEGPFDPTEFKAAVEAALQAES